MNRRREIAHEDLGRSDRMDGGDDDVVGLPAADLRPTQLEVRPLAVAECALRCWLHRQEWMEWRLPLGVPQPHLDGDRTLRSLQASTPASEDRGLESVADRLEASLQADTVEGGKREAGEALDAALERLKRRAERHPFFRGGTLDRGRIGQPPVRGHRLPRPVRTDLTRGGVT